MLRFLLLIRLAAAAMEAMCLQCRTGEHGHALQVSTLEDATRAHTHTNTPAGSLKKKKIHQQQLLTENNPPNKDELRAALFIYNVQHAVCLFCCVGFNMAVKATHAH